MFHFLPAGYPHTTCQSYMPYFQMQFISTLVGSASFVLSTQSLLYAVGLGAGSIPLAGALNWVVKDFIGQAGGVAFASWAGNFKGFDSNPKRWRMLSSVSMDASTLLEILSPKVAPLFPGSFLLIAGVANIGKNISYLSASASRASIHNNLARDSNLADVTAKAGSQSILASMLGTAVGCVISPIVGSEFEYVFMGFLALSAVGQTTNYLSLSKLSLRSLNTQRMDLLVQAYLSTEVVPSREAVALKETFVFKAKEVEWLSVGGSLDAVCGMDSDKLARLREANKFGSEYVLGGDLAKKTVVVGVLEGCEGKGLVRGVLQAHFLKQLIEKNEELQASTIEELVVGSRAILEEREEAFFAMCGEENWKVNDESVALEKKDGVRLRLE